jgi:1-aminocyclopropane-1-carboxylate deaminase/D-cysteine desulfhydrase-like pyridoxal-dependent ACC family enzyme
MVNAKIWMVQLVAVCLLIVAPLAPAQAAIIGTGAAIAMSERAQTEARVGTLLMQENVATQLEALGVDRDQALERVASLTDTELAQLEGRLELLPAGGNTLAVLGVVLLVLVILDIAGVTNIFTFI